MLHHIIVVSLSEHHVVRNTQFFDFVWHLSCIDALCGLGPSVPRSPPLSPHSAPPPVWKVKAGMAEEQDQRLARQRRQALL